MKAKNIDECIFEQEYRLAKLKFVQSSFPDTKVVASYTPGYSWKILNVEFTSKLVNTNFTDVKLITKHNTLYIAPFTLINFKFIQNGIEKNEDIMIGANPKVNRLAYIKTHWNNIKVIKPKNSPKQTISFARFNFNMKKHEFDEAIFKSCRGAIMQFIQNHPNIPLDDKHLEPKLKKLLIYT